MEAQQAQLGEAIGGARAAAIATRRLSGLADGERVDVLLRRPRPQPPADEARRRMAGAEALRSLRHRQRQVLGRDRGSASRSPRPGTIVRIARPLRVQPAVGRLADRRGDRARRRRRLRPRRAARGSPGAGRADGGRPRVAAGDDPERRPARAARPLLRPRAARSGERFRDAPAAKHYHQAYRHGLLEHTLSVAQGVSAAASFFPGIDRDVAITGALLHDIGKLEAYNDDPLAIDLTDLGRLIGEIPLGYYRVRREIESIDGFDPDLALGGPAHHPLPPRLARARLAGRPRHPRGHPRPHDGQPRRQARQLRPDRARPRRGPGLVEASTAGSTAPPTSAAARPERSRALGRRAARRSPR